MIDTLKHKKHKNTSLNFKGKHHKFYELIPKFSEENMESKTGTFFILIL